MGSHPVNLGFRFILELAALVAFAWWGWVAFGDGWQWRAVFAAPVAAGGAWGTFAVAGDPSRSGKAPVPVPGWLRLGLELLFFALGAWALGFTNQPLMGWGLGGLVLIHYALSWDRIAWLLRQ